MNYDLKIIKKKYGEKMSHLCRELFSTLLEEEGLLSNLLLEKFNENHYLYDDIVSNGLEYEFKDFIYSFVIEESNCDITVTKTPSELLEEVNYELFECKCEDDIQSFKKYYAKGEELCTFNGNRLNRCHVFFAVKKDVDEIKRSDFSNPSRQDLYGTSVISIQFAKDFCNTLSIKNRYNHNVNNPDATFSNNLDNIIEGLTDSFAKYYGMVQRNINNGFEIPGYVMANNGKFYKYNYEIRNVYYCSDNVIVDNFCAFQYHKSSYLVIDYFIIDLVTKSISIYDPNIYDYFVNCFINVDKINIKNIKDGKIIEILHKNDKKIEIIVNNFNKIISIYDNSIYFIKNSFLRYNNGLENLCLDNVVKIGDAFLYNNGQLKFFKAFNLESVGDSFLYKNYKLEGLDVPNLKKADNYFLYFNDSLRELDVPKLEKVGYNFLRHNSVLSKINAPNLVNVRDNFLCYNTGLKELCLDSLEEVGLNFMFKNVDLEKLVVPKLKIIDDFFLVNNKKLSVLILPSVVDIGYEFLKQNFDLKYFEAPVLKCIGSNFLVFNSELKDFYAPNLERVGDNFMYCNTNLVNFMASNLKEVGSKFLYSHCCRNYILGLLRGENNYFNYLVLKLRKNKFRTDIKRKKLK